MKQLFCILLALVSFSSCSDNNPTPAPGLTGDSWTLQSRITVSTPKDKAPEAPIAYPIKEKVTLTFLSDTRFNMAVELVGAGSTQRFEGTYTYQGQTLTFPAILGWPTPFVVPRTMKVVELSAHKLVTEYQGESVDVGDGYYEPTTYVTTQTYTR